MPRVSTTVDIPVARAYVPLLRPARYKGAKGGRGSAKSRFFSGNLIREMLIDRTLRTVCVREIQRTLEQSVKRLIEDRIKEHQLQDIFDIKHNQIETAEGGIVIFQGMQDHTAESIKSLEGFDRAWVEEAQTLSERSLTLLRPTIRKPGSEIWFSWNPRHATDAVDQFMRAPNAPPGAVVVHTTYADNPWFPDVLRDEMEWDRKVDPEKYAHVWLGEYERHSEARVFKNWTVDAFDTPESAVLLYGGDWGFSVDPTVAIRMWEDKNPAGRKRLNIDREVYKIGCEIDHIPALFDTLDGGEMRKWPSIADSARPETISYMQRHGYPRMEAAKKGPDSVKEGVIFLQGYDIRIHPRCTHVIDEFTMYSYEIDKQTGIVTPKLADKKNHTIDSVRYAAERLRKPASSLVW